MDDNSHENGFLSDMMRGGIEREIKQGTKRIVDNVYTFVALFAVIALIAVVFARFNVTDFFTFNFASEVIIILFLYYIMYYAMGCNGVRDGRLNAEYKTVRARYDSIRDNIRDDMFSSLEDFCEEYVADELVRARRKCLRAANVKYEDFINLYSCGELLPAGLTHKKRRAIARARKMKSIELSFDMLLSFGRVSVRRSPLGASPGVMRGRRATIQLLPMTIMGFFTASVVVELIAKPTWATVITGLLKLITILVVGVKGYSSGYENIVDDTCSYVNRQINLLSLFIEWRSKKEIKK